LLLLLDFLYHVAIIFWNHPVELRRNELIIIIEHIELIIIIEHIELIIKIRELIIHHVHIVHIVHIVHVHIVHIHVVHIHVVHIHVVHIHVVHIHVVHVIIRSSRDFINLTTNQRQSYNKYWRKTKKLR
jgi:hypothetical protein